MAHAAPAELDPARATDAFLRLIPREFARAHHCCSQGRDEQGREILAVVENADPFACFNVGVRLGRATVHVVRDKEAIHALIDAAYERHAGQRAPAEREALGVDLEEVAEEDIDALLARAERDLLTTSGKAPVVQLVDRLLFAAIHRGASDLHLQPLADEVVVRMRVDGVLGPGYALPPALLAPVISRIKVMGRMDVAEHLIPQDGRATVRLGEREVDLRIASLPTAHGERVVIRLLDVSSQLHDFPQLGMPASVAERFLALARRSHGIVLVTGPTGSGKTTTLYATLRELDAGERNIMTIEDPIEYELDNLGLPISQSQVNEKKGVTFAHGLRHILRQDPDVILVGEIRDFETARIAIQSSLTGHLVFSTLHTNDAVSAVTRLIELGVEPYLVADSLSGILAQRLVRTCCAECGGEGCGACEGSGYRGRTGIFELAAIDESLRRAVHANATVEELRRLAREGGMHTLAEEGTALVEAGRTTPTEVERVIHG